MITVVVSLVILVGVFFVLIAALGVFRMPDLYTRMHAATKAGAFGGSLLLIAACIFFASWGVAIKCLLVIVIFYATTPIASHMIGRAAYLLKVQKWSGTVIDEMSGRYDLQKRHLKSLDD